MILYEEDTGGPSGGSGGESFSQTASEVFEEGKETPPVEPTEETVSSSTGGSGDSGDSKPTTPALTAKEIADAVREGVRQPEQQKEYSQEELDKIFKVWQPDEGLVAKLMAGGTEAVEALKLMREGLAGQFGQLVKYQLEALKRELADQYNPALTIAQEIKAERERDAFFKEYEDLKPHANLVDIAYKSLLGEKKTFPTLKDAQKALADRARQLIPNGNGSGTTSSGGARTTTTTTTKPKPAALSSGSQAGGGGGNSAPPNVFHEIFGNG